MKKVWCKKHPKYWGIREPKRDCKACDLIYINRGANEHEMMMRGMTLRMGRAMRKSIAASLGRPSPWLSQIKPGKFPESLGLTVRGVGSSVGA
jgi:urease accessory protein UreF